MVKPDEPGAGAPSERASGAEELEALRARLDVLDEGLLRAAAERQAVVARIGALKAREGRALFDRERERVVLARAERVAGEVGLDAETARGLMGVLVGASHRRQAEVVQAKAEERAEGAAPSVLVVGGGGQMGRLVGRALGERGARVAVLERDDGQDRAAVVKAADLVVLAVPMGAAVEVARELGPWVREDALLCDINSLKGEICEVMGEVCRGEVLGMHPMFGPTVASLLRQKWVLCPVRPGRWSRWLEGELGSLGLEILRSEPREHDRMMSAVQVLVHFHTLVMGEALRRAGLGVEESLRFTSPIYRIELAVVGRLFGQDPDLYAEIEMSNPYGREVLGHFLEATLGLKEIIEAGDRDAFRGVFGEVAEHFGEFKGEASALSDFLIEELVRKA